MSRLSGTGFGTGLISVDGDGSVAANVVKGTDSKGTDSPVPSEFALRPIRVLEQSEHDHIVLMQGYARSVEQAHEQGLLSMRQLRMSCNEFAAGAFEDFSVVSRNAHLAAFSLMTYGEACACLSVLSPANCERLLLCGRALQDRVLAHELCYLQNDLSPGNAFYDDLFPLDVMGLPPKFVATKRAEIAQIPGHIEHTEHIEHIEQVYSTASVPSQLSNLQG